MKTTSKPSLKELRRALTGHLKSPNTDPQTALLLSSGNQSYYLQRAQEAIQSAQSNLENSGNVDLRIKDVQVALLLLAASNVIDWNIPL